LQLLVLRLGAGTLAPRPPERHLLFRSRSRRRARAVGFDHDQSGIVEQLLRFDFRLLEPWLFSDWLRLRRDVLRLNLLRLLLAPRLKLVDAPLRLDHSWVDVRGRGRVASLAALTIPTAPATPAAPMLLAVALGARITGIRARVLELRLGIGFGERLRLLLLLRALSLLASILARTAIRPAIVPLPIAPSIPLLLAIGPLLQAALLLAVAAVFVAPAVTSVAASVASAVASPVAAAVAAITAVVVAVVTLLLLG
jgi:hypothetical protein